MKEVSEIKSTDQKIAEALLDNPNALDTICKHLACGGSLVELARMWDIPYWAITSWVHKDKDRVGAMNQSMILRSEYYIEKVQQLLKDLTESNIQDLYDDAGCILNPKEMPRTIAAAVASIEVMEEYQGSGREREYIGQTKKVKFWDKTKAIEMLAKSLGMFVQEVSVTHKVTLEDLVVASRDVEPLDKK